MCLGFRVSGKSLEVGFRVSASFFIADHRGRPGEVVWPDGGGGRGGGQA